MTSMSGNAADIARRPRGELVIDDQDVELRVLGDVDEFEWLSRQFNGMNTAPAFAPCDEGFRTFEPHTQ